MNKPFALTATAALTALLLTACGGGSDEGVIAEDRSPTPSGQTATLTITNASDAALNGAYASTDVLLNNVTKVNPIGGDPETCRFRFEGPTQAGNTRRMTGEIRYLPGNPSLRFTSVAIGATEFRLDGTNGATVDRTNNRVVFTNAVLGAAAGTLATPTGQITLSGFVPMRGNRPEGC